MPRSNRPFTQLHRYHQNEASNRKLRQNGEKKGRTPNKIRRTLTLVVSWHPRSHFDRFSEDAVTKRFVTNDACSTRSWKIYALKLKNSPNPNKMFAHCFKELCSHEQKFISVAHTILSTDFSFILFGITGDLFWEKKKIIIFFLNQFSRISRIYRICRTLTSLF